MAESSTQPRPISANDPAVSAAEAAPGIEGFDPSQFNVVKEGKAAILFPKGNQVFYNPVQEFNRDLSILFLKLLIDDLKSNHGVDKVRVLEALSASGLRSIRYAKEVEGVEKIIANDLIEDAVKTIKRNIAYCNVPEGLIDVRHSDAKFLMYKLLNDVEGKRNDPATAIHYVDIDPYGGAQEFLDGAVQLVADNGIIGVTCTDLAVLCGNYSESCFAKYGSMPPKRAEYCHEMALRIVLATCAITAARYKRVIEPVFSYHADYYVRMFIRVHTSAGEVKHTATKLGYIYQCNRCPEFHIQRAGKFSQVGNSRKFAPGAGPPTPVRCPSCDGTQSLGGPFWVEPLHDHSWLDRAITHLKELNTAGILEKTYGTHKRILSYMFNCKEELPDIPLYYTSSRLANSLRTTTPKMDAVRSAIHKLGYRVSLSHTECMALKTDCPFEVLIDIFKVWDTQTRTSTGSGASIKPNSPAESLWKRPITHVPEEKRATLFEIVPEACVSKVDEDGQYLARYLPNPLPDWGPGSRAGRKRGVESMTEALAIKRAENQGKYAKKRKTAHGSTPNAGGAEGPESSDSAEDAPQPEEEQQGSDKMDI